MRTQIVPILAKKFLLSKSSEKFLSLITWVSVLGITLGVLALIVVTSVINGFEGELQRVITGMNGDVLFYSKAEPVGDPVGLEDKIRRTIRGVADMTPSLVTELMIGGPNGVAGAVLEGVDLTTLGKVTRIPDGVIEGRLAQADGEIAIASVLANRIGAQLGTEVRLIFPFISEQASSDQDSQNLGSPKIFKARVVGMVRMGMYEYDSKTLFAPLPSVQNWTGQIGKIKAFKIRLQPGVDSRTASDRLADNFGYPFRSKDWGQMNKNLFYAIRLEKAVISIILTGIILVAAFNVVSTLMMMIHDKTREIAILKAMGLRPGQCFSLFAMIGLGIGGVGTAMGLGLGMGVLEMVKRFRWIQLPAEIYYISFLPVTMKWAEVCGICGMAILVALLATLYPAWNAARNSPLDGLRYD